MVGGIKMKQSNNYKKLDYKKLNKLIALLDKAMPFAPENKQLDMREGSILNRDDLRGHECGTIHCFLGWVYIANYYIKDGKMAIPKRVSYIGYVKGLNLMKRILGLELNIWAKANDEIWGNENGGYISCGKKAFYHKTKRPNGAENLSHIRDHLFEVSSILKTLILGPKLKLN